MSCFVLINSVLINLLCVWIWHSLLSVSASDISLTVGFSQLCSSYCWFQQVIFLLLSVLASDIPLTVFQSVIFLFCRFQPVIFLFLSVSASDIRLFLQLPDDAGLSRSVHQHRQSSQGAFHLHPQRRRHRHRHRLRRLRRLERFHRVQVQTSVRLQQTGKKHRLVHRGVCVSRLIVCM